MCQPRPDSDSVHSTAVAVTIIPSTANGTIQASAGSTAPVFCATSRIASNDSPNVQAAMLRKPTRASQTVMRSIAATPDMCAEHATQGGHTPSRADRRNSGIQRHHAGSRKSTGGRAHTPIRTQVRA